MSAETVDPGSDISGNSGTPEGATRLESIHSRLTAELVERLAEKVAIDGAVGGRIQSYSPLTGELIADYPACAPQDVRAAFAKARRAQAAWAQTPLRDRAAHRRALPRPASRPG